MRKKEVKSEVHRDEPLIGEELNKASGNTSEEGIAQISDTASKDSTSRSSKKTQSTASSTKSSKKPNAVISGIRDYIFPEEDFDLQRKIISSAAHIEKIMKYAFGALAISATLSLITITALIIAFYDGKANFERLTTINQEALNRYVININTLTQRTDVLAEIKDDMEILIEQLSQSNELYRLSQDNTKIAQLDITGKLEKVTALLNNESRRIKKLVGQVEDLSIFGDTQNLWDKFNTQTENVQGMLNDISKSINSNKGLKRNPSSVNNSNVLDELVKNQKKTQAEVEKMNNSLSSLIGYIEQKEKMVSFP